MKKWFAFIFVALALEHSLDAQTQPQTMRPANIPANVQLHATVPLKVIVDPSGSYTIIPAAAILKIADDSPIKTPTGNNNNISQKNFVVFETFYNNHKDEIELIQGVPKQGDTFNLVIYDGQVNNVPKTKKVVIAVNNNNVPISMFEQQAGMPMATLPKK